MFPICTLIIPFSKSPNAAPFPFSKLKTTKIENKRARERERL